MSYRALLTPVRWMLAAAVSAVAAQLAIVHATPIDLALPFIAVLVTLVAATSYPSLMLAVPLLVLIENLVPAENQRLLLIGAVVSVVFGASVVRSLAGGAAKDRRRDTAAWWWVASPYVITVCAILLLRWIPFDEVRLGRELMLLGMALAIVAALRGTPLAIGVAVVTALVTPAVPLRTLALPLAVLLVAGLARFYGAPRIALAWPSALVVGFVTLFFPWSGVLARAFPYFMMEAEAESHRWPVHQALAAGRSSELDVPHDATAVIVSGANVAHLRRGTPLGRIEPGGIEVRIGDASDWGYLRRDHFYGARNPLPRDPAGKVRGYGYVAWLDGAGRIALPPGARTITVTADASLPPDAALQVDAFERR